MKSSEAAGLCGAFLVFLSPPLLARKETGRAEEVSPEGVEVFLQFTCTGHPWKAKPSTGSSFTSVRLRQTRVLARHPENFLA